MPQTVAFVSARDGVGKSTLITNLGRRCPAVSEPGCPLDLCGQFGSAALLLNLRPEHTSSTLQASQATWTSIWSRPSLERHPSTLRVLAGAPSGPA